MPLRLVAIAVALALAVFGCSGGDDDDDGDDKDDTETSASESVKPAVDLAVSTADLISPHQATGPLEVETRDAVVDVIEWLLLVTSAGPLVAGKAGGGFAKLFTADAGARAANNDREVFFDEGLPKFGELVPEEASVSLTALAGTTDPATALVIAKFRWNVTSKAVPANRVVREGELQLIPDDDGDWKVAAYTLVVTRTIDDSTTTTTAASE